ncbi:MAG: 2Fe-2S ferredoxin [Legionellales bacterium]|nr:2Fe-2S ferredoxin [Legionellales bacterium]
MNYYQKHLFFCTNHRDNGKACCAANDATSMRTFAQLYLRDQGLIGPGKYRTSTAGCLGRCAEGPILVIYPEGVWYTYSSQADVQLILDEHVIKGQIVPHLLLPEAAETPQ